MAQMPNDVINEIYHDGYMAGYDEGFQAAIPRWVPVTDRLPPDGMCLCRNDAGIHIVLECADGKFNAFRLSNGKLYDKNEIKDIAYWMPLPEPPEGENREKERSNQTVL